MKLFAKQSTVIFLSLMIGVAVANAQTSVFTYQGKLTDGGAPANATYDMRFQLFDAPTGGTQVGMTFIANGVQTLAGIFSVEIDFGAPAFSGADRFLEVAISPAGQNNFTTLAPRQRLNSAPYSLKSLNAGTSSNSLNLGGTPADQFVLTNDSRMSDPRPPLPGSGDYVQNSSTAQLGANFNVAGTGTAGVMNAVTHFEVNGNRILSAGGIENLFVGQNAGASNTGGANNAFFGANAGVMNTTGALNTFVGSDAGRNTTTGGANSFFGKGAGQSNTVGANNSFFGIGAGFTNTSGFNNSFFGRSAGFNNTTGTFNSFVGDGAGFANTTGAGNTFLGDNAGNHNTTGSQNVFIGQDSGNPQFTTQVSDSVAIGANASVSQSNSVAIGANASVSQADTIVLGTATQKTLLEGRLRTGAPFGVAAGDLPGRGYMETFFVTNTFQGLYTPNVIFGSYTANPLGTVIPCVRFQGIPGQTAGVILANCSSPLSSVDDKTEIQTFTGGLDIVTRLTPVTFRHKENGMRGVGLNAEDVADIDPSLVQRDDELSIYKVNETSLNMVLVNAVKQQHGMLQKQEKQIRRLQTQVDTLMKLVCSQNAESDACKEN